MPRFKNGGPSTESVMCKAVDRGMTMTGVRLVERMVGRVEVTSEGGEH